MPDGCVGGGIRLGGHCDTLGSGLAARSVQPRRAVGAGLVRLVGTSIRDTKRSILTGVHLVSGIFLITYISSNIKAND